MNFNLTQTNNIVLNGIKEKVVYCIGGNIGYGKKNPCPVLRTKIENQTWNTFSHSSLPTLELARKTVQPRMHGATKLSMRWTLTMLQSRSCSIPGCLRASLSKPPLGLGTTKGSREMASINPVFPLVSSKKAHTYRQASRKYSWKQSKNGHKTILL